MEYNTLYTILKIISVNASSSILVSKGYTPSQIALLIRDVEEGGFVVVSEDGSLQLTGKGKNMISEYQDGNNLKGSNSLVFPQDDKRVTPLNKYDIIFPSKW